MGSARTSFAFATEQCAGIEVAILRCLATSTDREGAELLVERGQCIACASGSAPLSVPTALACFVRPVHCGNIPILVGLFTRRDALVVSKHVPNSQCCFPLLIPIQGVSRRERDVLTPTVALQMLHLTWASIASLSAREAALLSATENRGFEVGCLRPLRPIGLRRFDAAWLRSAMTSHGPVLARDAR